MITVLVAIDLPDEHEVPGTPLEGYHPELDDVANAIAVRLEEFYPDSTGGFARPLQRRVVATTAGVAKHVLDAALVGLDSGNEMLDVAGEAVVVALSTAPHDVAVAIDPSRVS